MSSDKKINNPSDIKANPSFESNKFSEGSNKKSEVSSDLSNGKP